MINPLVDSFANLTDTQIDNKIQELSRNYWASRNPDLQYQIGTILEMFKEEARARRARAFMRHNDNNDENGLDNLINVS